MAHPGLCLHLNIRQFEWHRLHRCQDRCYGSKRGPTAGRLRLPSSQVTHAHTCIDMRSTLVTNWPISLQAITILLPTVHFGPDPPPLPGRLLLDQLPKLRPLARVRHVRGGAALPTMEDARLGATDSSPFGPSHRFPRLLHFPSPRPGLHSSLRHG